MLADRLLHTAPSATKAVTAKAAALQQQGLDVIALSQGEPDLDTPEAVQDAAIRAIRGGKTRYTAVAGVTELREAICAKLLDDNSLAYHPDQITVACGAKQVLFNALFATLNSGDEVIIPTPCWVSYAEMVRLAGGVPRFVVCTRENGFKLTPAQLGLIVSERTKWLILNSPNNPTGAVYSARELEGLAEALRKHEHVWVLSDDIYEKLVFAPAQFATLGEVAPELIERMLVVNGVSKASCMTGWRVGYGAGPKKLIAAMNTIQSQTSSHTSSISQYAAIEAIAGTQAHVAMLQRVMQRRRDEVLRILTDAPGLACDRPDGAFYVFPSCDGLIGRRTGHGELIVSDEDVAVHLLERARVAVVPGRAFQGPGHFRLSFASDDAALRQACTRIVEACEALS